MIVSRIFKQNLQFIHNLRTIKAGIIRLASTKSQISTEEVNKNGLLILNRPSALNAMNLEMVDRIYHILNNWNYTKSIIVVRGSGGKAFCPGGDIKRTVENDESYGAIFARNLYLTVYKIATLNVPYIALMDGITMGAGLGLAVHGKYRIATERTVVAMPEAMIGFFTDVSASYFLPRLQKNLGFYMALCGARLTGSDVLHAGIATHYCSSEKIVHLEHALLHSTNANDIDRVIDEFCPKVQSNFGLSEHLDQIEKCFEANSVEEILSKLESDGSEWAKKNIQILRLAAPLGLKVTLHLLKRGANLSLEECVEMEYILARQMLCRSDFKEGVRALLTSKDGRPKWHPSCLEDVTDQQVLAQFESPLDTVTLPLSCFQLKN